MQAHIPHTMHAIDCRTFGGGDVMQWSEYPTPVPRNDQVLIKVAAAGVNRADIMQRQGQYPPPQGSSPIIGLEVSGTVVALGPHVIHLKVGDQICALLPGGGYAEYVAVSEGICLPVPPSLSLLEAAALPECVTTVWANVFDIAALKPNETVLVHGGTSGIGTTAIRLIKLFGATIFVTTSSEEKCESCRQWGADLAINYKIESFVDAINKATSGHGVDIVLDMLGGDTVADNLSVLAPAGRHVSIAVQGGKAATIDLWQIMKKKLHMTGSTLRHRPLEEKARLVREIKAKVWPWAASGQLKPLIYKIFPIKSAAEAHKVMESRTHIGKIVLEVAC
jgi:NADPH:quinone reductase